MKLWNGDSSASAESGKGTYDWMKKPFIWLFLLYAISLLALLRANYYYVDDLGRAVWGYRGWLDWSRYTTTILSIFVHPTSHVTDLSPLPQLLAIGVMSLSGLLVIYTFTGKKEIRWPFLLAALPMGISPWFLECFSYKFDAPYIAVSVLASVVPFLWWEKDQKKFLLASFLCLLVMITTYQAASGIFVVETLFLSFFSWSRGGKGKEILSWMSASAASYIIVMLIFKLTLQRPASEDYVIVTTPSLGDLPTVLLQNARDYMTTVMGDLNLFMQILAGAAIAFLLLHILQETKRNRVLTLLLALVLLAVTLVLSYGAYLALAKPLLSPRGLLGMGLWFSFVLISLMAMAGEKAPVKWLMVFLSWQLIAGAAAYGNALTEQKQYTDFRVQLLVQDLNTLHLIGDEDVQYFLQGNIGKAPAVRNVVSEYPAVKRLVTTSFGDHGLWESFYFYFYHDLGIHASAYSASIKQQKEHAVSEPLPLLLENNYHRIESDGKDVIIRLKPSKWTGMLNEKGN